MCRQIIVEASELKEVLLLIVIFYAAWEDWRRKSISFLFLLAAGGIGIIFCFLLRRDWIEVLFSCGVGMVLLVLEKLTGGKIGAGDGWFFVVLGFYLDWDRSICIFLSGLFPCFWVSLPLVILNLRRKRNAKMTLPFIPFLIPGGIWLFFGGGGMV